MMSCASGNSRRLSIKFMCVTLPYMSIPGRAVILAENWDKLQENDEWLNYYRWFATWNPYGDVSKMPQADQQIICEAFQEHVKKQQEALTDPNEYYPLQIFVLPK